MCMSASAVECTFVEMRIYYRMGRNKTSLRRLALCLAPFVLTSFIMAFLLWIGKFAPFGGNTLAVADAKIQYLDFFAYLKDVLEGKNRFSYTFSAGLGGTAIAILSYYLASPFNLLVLLFKKSQLTTFINVLISLKIAASGATFSWFLQRRFYDRIRDSFVILLSVGYALMQYNLAQGSNVMWLDGVIMLPLILLGVHRVVHTRRMYVLTIPVGLCILFNWYTGGINCLYSIVWFAFEFLLAEISPESSLTPVGSGDPERLGAKVRGIKGLFLRFIGTTFRYGISMAMGVALSAVLFLPTISALSKGKGSGFYPEDYLIPVWNGAPVELIPGFTFGAVSSQANVALFCGALAVIGCLGFFLCREYSIPQKILAGLMLVGTLISFYWQPLFYIFSLFQPADSYWFRYGYLGSFVILFLAGCYFQTRPKSGESVVKKGSWIPFVASVAWCVAMFVVNGRYGTVAKYRVVETSVFVMTTAVVLTLMFAMTKWKKGLVFGLTIVTVLGCGVNAQQLMDHYYSDIVDHVSAYSAQAQEQVDALKAYDDSFYRVSQTSTKEAYHNNLTASYDDPLAYGYASLSTYTSCTEGDQLWLLERLGYKQHGKVMNIVNTSFVPSDSFLGVKYVWSENAIPGLEPVEGLGTYNGKTAYENPYALPVAFVYSGESLPDHTYNDPFTYTDEIYSTLSGETVSLYQKLSPQKIEEDGNYIWTMEVPEGNYSLYGNLPWNETSRATLRTGEGYVSGTGLLEKESSMTGYAQWLSPSLFHIPVEDGQKNVTVVLSAGSDRVLDQKEENEQFYALDLDALKEAASMIQSRAAQNIEVRNGSFRCTANAKAGESLLVTIPKQSGWTYKVNGKEVHCDKFAYCLMSLPLEEGENVIELTYSIPYIEKGAIASVGTLVILALYEIWFRKRAR